MNRFVSLVCLLLTLLLFSVSGCFVGAPTSSNQEQPPANIQSTETEDPVETACQEGKEKVCFPGPSNQQGVGICSPGKSTCEKGRWSPCLGYTLASKELCDGKDNDCDGKVDEDFQFVKTCFVGVGECQTMGNGVCSKDGLTTVCNGPRKNPSTEICDGKDNDCDGEIDENLGC